MDVMARWGEQEWYRLNRFLQHILWAAILFNGYLAVTILTDEVYDSTPWVGRITVVVAAVASATGAFLILRFMRRGFYLMMAAQPMSLIGLFALTGRVTVEDVSTCVLSMSFIAGSLLMTNKCKMNAYDLLWPDDNSVRPANFLEEHSKHVSHNE